MAAVDPQTLGWGLTKLATAFPGSFGTPEKARDVGTLWRDLLEQHRWVTRAVFVAGVYRMAWEHPGDFLPPPKRVLEFFDAARDEVARNAVAARLQTQAALPIPEAPDERARLEADARAEAEKGLARALLPPRMRATSPKRKEAPR